MNEAIIVYPWQNLSLDQREKSTILTLLQFKIASDMTWGIK